MDSKKVVYTVNGVASNVYRRLIVSKTFWVALLFMLGAAEKWNQKELSGRAFFATVFGGVMAILIRSAIAKATLASNALNPDITHVTAVEKPVGPTGTVISSIFMGAFIFCLACLPLALSGCGETAAANGKQPVPIFTGKVCLGSWCIGQQTTDTLSDVATIAEPLPPAPPPLLPQTITKLERADILPTIEK